MPGIRNSSTTYLLTAGHCFTVNTTIDNGAYINVPRSSLIDINFVMGTIRTRDVTNSSLDTDYINTRRPAPDLHSRINSTTTVIVAGKTTSRAGRRSVRAAPIQVTTMEPTLTTPTRAIFLRLGSRLPHVLQPRSFQSSRVRDFSTTPGWDSGGTVFRFSGSNALAVGTITDFSTADEVDITYSTWAWDH